MGFTVKRSLFVAAGLALALAFTSGAEGCESTADQGAALPTPASTAIGEGGVIHPSDKPMPIPKAVKPFMLPPNWEPPEPARDLTPRPQVDAEPVPFLNRQSTKDIERVVEFFVSTDPLGGSVYIDWSVGGEINSEIYHGRKTWVRTATVRQGQAVSATVTPVNVADRNLLNITCIITVTVANVGKFYVDDDQVWREQPRVCGVLGIIP